MAIMVILDFGSLPSAVARRFAAAPRCLRHHGRGGVSRNQILCRPRHKSLNFSCQTKKSLLYVFSLAEIDHPATQPVGAESEDGLAV